MGQKDNLKAIADAIRTKEGTTDSIPASTFAERILALKTGGVDTSDATATSSDIINGKTAYARGSKITGTLPVLRKIETSVTPLNQGSVSAGGYCSNNMNLTIIATPNANQDFIDFEDSTGNILSETSPYTFSVTKDMNIIARFRNTSYNGIAKDWYGMKISGQVPNWYTGNTCYGNGKYLSVSQTGKIISSVNGINWSIVSSVNKYTFSNRNNLKLLYFKEKFFIISNTMICILDKDFKMWIDGIDITSYKFSAQIYTGCNERYLFILANKINNTTHNKLYLCDNTSGDFIVKTLPFSTNWGGIVALKNGNMIAIPAYHSQNLSNSLYNRGAISDTFGTTWTSFSLPSISGSTSQVASHIYKCGNLAYYSSGTRVYRTYSEEDLSFTTSTGINNLILYGIYEYNNNIRIAIGLDSSTSEGVILYNNNIWNSFIKVQEGPIDDYYLPSVEGNIFGGEINKIIIAVNGGLIYSTKNGPIN